MFYLCLATTIISSLVSLSFAISAFLQAKNQAKPALDNAKYAVACSLALAISAGGLIIFPSITYLTIMAVVMIMVQFFDGIVGLRVSLFKTVGPFATAFFQFHFSVASFYADLYLPITDE